MWDATDGAEPCSTSRGTRARSARRAFSPDGSRIVTDSGEDAKVWDARTGEELKGEPIPPEPRTVQISPDGRWLAHSSADTSKLIPLQPDAEELAYRGTPRRSRTSWRYREGYDAARAAKDDFAARFYLNLFPPPERTRIRAEEIVEPLFGRLLLRDDVLAALQAQPAADPELQAACLKLAGTWPESAAECNNVAWSPGCLPRAAGRDVPARPAPGRAACRLEPDHGDILNTLGVAQYRCGLMAEAIATLSRSVELNKEARPGDLAFLALAQHRLGQSEEARDTLGRLREVMKNPRWDRIRRREASCARPRRSSSTRSSRPTRSRH